MDLNTLFGPAWQQPFYEACYRHCCRGFNPGIPPPTPAVPAAGAKAGVYDFRIFANEDLPLRKTLALAMLARAFQNRADPLSFFADHRLAILRSSFPASDVTWALRQMLGDNLEVADSYYDKEKHALRVVAYEDPRSGRRLFRDDLFSGLLNRKDPAFVLVRPEDSIPAPLQGLQPEEIRLGAIDREMLTVLMTIRYPALSTDALMRLTEAMPKDGELAEVGAREILLSFRAADPKQLPAALHRYVEGARRKNRHASRSVVTLAKMAGLGAAKEAAQEIVAALRDWKAGALDWSEVPRGLLLAREPGTGKTELARAMAGEAGIRLIEASYSTWQQAGPLSSLLTAMNRSFEEARANAPSILFIDEIDAFSRRRGADANGHNDSYDVKVITALLEQLDGMAEREGVVILSACNRLDLLDPAICRSGRFDTVIRVECPGLEDLAAILGQHLGDDAERIDLNACAAAALGQTGADCAAAVRKARMAARRFQRGCCTADLMTALGGTDPGYSADDWLRLAVNECGHAIVATALRVAKAEVLRVESRGGICRFRELPALATAEQMHRMRCLNLAGQASEQLMFGSLSSGSGGGTESDLALATQSAADQIAAFGLGSTGPVWFGPAGSGEAREEALNSHLPEVAGLLETARQDALQILTVNKDLLLRMAEELASARVLFGSGLTGKLQAVISAHHGVYELNGL